MVISTDYINKKIYSCDPLSCNFGVQKPLVSETLPKAKWVSIGDHILHYERKTFKDQSENQMLASDSIEMISMTKLIELDIIRYA